jgi:MFS transporter, SP family, arabinose:H+ symporter
MGPIGGQSLALQTDRISMSNSFYILFAVTAAALGGFLFGYDTAVISGAIGSLERYFALSPTLTGWAGASAIMGCIPGAMVAGFLSDRFGRKKVLVLSAWLYFVSALWSGLAGTFTWFVVARFLGGLGIGISSMVCPTYIAEISPERHRGRLGALFQLGIVLGIFMVFFVNMLIQRSGTEAWNLEYGWRWMLASECFPATLLLMLLVAVPESPRWLLQVGRESEARGILARMLDEEAMEQEITRILAMSGAEKGRFVELFQTDNRRPLLIAVGLALFAQFSGINAIMYYAPEVFKMAGDSSRSAFQSAVWVGAINLLFTFVAIGLVDRTGRKPLLLAGSLIQVAALGFVGWRFQVGGGGVELLFGVLAFVAAFAVAMGPIPWIVISEIFPGRIRGRAVSVGVFMIWVGCYVVAQTFPILRQEIGPAATFWIYAACSLGGFLFVLLLLPETKGRTLEEIAVSWAPRRVHDLVGEPMPGVRL